jgi:glycosyltransferase involved in cell wall biosynthesis
MSQSALPFVSAICITGKSRFHVEELLPQAAESFRLQTYPEDRRHLVVVTDLSKEAVVKMAEKWGFQYRVCLAPVGESLGALRNIGLNNACADLAIQWDDDDWHHAGRIATQVSAWLEYQHLGPAVCLQRQLAYDWATDIAYVREFPHTPIQGSILHAIGAERYPGKDKEEDTDFFAKFYDRVVAVDNRPELYVRFSHGRNTWTRDHIMREARDWPDGTWNLGDHAAEYLRSVLTRYDATAMRRETCRSTGSAG